MKTGYTTQHRSNGLLCNVMENEEAIHVIIKQAVKNSWAQVIFPCMDTEKLREATLKSEND